MSAKQTQNAVVTADRVRVSRQSTEIPIPVSGSTSGPALSVSRDGDVVRDIDVRCRCGETIRIHCDYDNV